MTINADIFTQLEEVIAKRLQQSPDESYVASLSAKGTDTVLKKIGEEATELAIAAKAHEFTNNREEIVYEACDLLFHMLVLLGKEGIQLDEIRVELSRRFGMSGITEKQSRTK